MRYVPLRALTLAELASSVLQRNGPWHGDELAPRRLVVALLLSAGAAASAPPSIRGSVGAMRRTRRPRRRVMIRGDSSDVCGSA